MTQKIAIWAHPTTLSGYIFATEACIDNRKKLAKQQYLLHMFPAPFPQIDIIGDCDDRLDGKGEKYQVCSVQYCVQQLCTVRCTHI